MGEIKFIDGLIFCGWFVIEFVKGGGMLLEVIILRCDKERGSNWIIFSLEI